VLGIILHLSKSHPLELLAWHCVLCGQQQWCHTSVVAAETATASGCCCWVGGGGSQFHLVLTTISGAAHAHLRPACCGLSSPHPAANNSKASSPCTSGLALAACRASVCRQCEAALQCHAAPECRAASSCGLWQAQSIGVGTVWHAASCAALLLACLLGRCLQHVFVRTSDARGPLHLSLHLRVGTLSPEYLIAASCTHTQRVSRG
jgi:hypothetical protein